MGDIEDKQLPSNSSYIVLSRCTDDENNETINFPNYQLQENIKISELSQSPKDPQVISPEVVVAKGPTADIEKRLSDLLSENMSLKETLHQNNMAMKQQFNTLCLWQEEILKVHQSHKERFDETKQLIVKLITENKDLRSQNEKIQEKAEMKQLQLEKEDLRKKLQDTESRLNQMIMKVNKKRQQPSVKEKELGSIVEMLTERLEIAERARRQLEIDVERLNAQKARLEQRFSLASFGHTLQMGNLDKTKTAMAGNSLPLLKEIKDYLLQNQKRLPSHLTQVPDDSEERNEDLSPQTISLRKLLIEEHEDNCKTKHYLKMITFEYEKYLNLQSNISNDMKAINQAYSELNKKKEDTEPLDTLVAKMMCRDEEINYMNQQIDTLKCRIKMLEAENEAVQILKAQVSVYQTDFNIERKNREDLAAEREKLLSDMRQLLKQNKHLTEELAKLQGSDCPNLKGSDDGHIDVNSLEFNEEISGDFICPNPECSMRFSKLEPLQVHVEQCLKLTD